MGEYTKRIGEKIKEITTTIIAWIIVITIMTLIATITYKYATTLK